MKIQELIDQTIAKMVGAPRADSVDTVKMGDATQELTGVVSTFMATRAVLERAVELGANLVITHEPTFYNHLDATDWLGDDPVYAAKRAFIEEHRLVIWRLHDYIHQYRPDGILAGMLSALGWADCAEHEIVTLPQPLSAGELAAHCKERLGIATVKLAGPPDVLCRKLALRVGASGGRGQILALRRPDIDAVLCGESPEWETCEYVRDANAAGLPKALIVLGHANSEEAGMGWLAEWLHALLPPEIAATHVMAGDPFTFR